jgi:hypothetical protein
LTTTESPNSNEKGATLDGTLAWLIEWTAVVIKRDEAQIFFGVMRLNILFFAVFTNLVLISTICVAHLDGVAG